MILATTRTRAPRALRKHDPRRSNHWPSVRKAHLKLQPACQMCGTMDELEVHHIRPFHLHPELELEQSNLITLCEKRGHDCHFVAGHFHNWRAFNPNVIADVQHYHAESEEAHAALVDAAKRAA